jgi:hypothetical protein
VDPLHDDHPGIKELPVYGCAGIHVALYGQVVDAYQQYAAFDQIFRAVPGKMHVIFMEILF